VAFTKSRKSVIRTIVRAMIPGRGTRLDRACRGSCGTALGDARVVISSYEIATVAFCAFGLAVFAVTTLFRTRTAGNSPTNRGYGVFRSVTKALGAFRDSFCIARTGCLRLRDLVISLVRPAALRLTRCTATRYCGSILALQRRFRRPSSGSSIS